MKIKGKTIGIRTFQSEDAVAFHEAAIESIEHMYKFMPWCHPNYSLQEAETWVKSRIESWNNDIEYSFIIYAIKTNELLGGVDINQINHSIGNIGYWVRKKAVSKGVATEAVSLITGYGFNQLSLNRLEIVTLPDNKACRKVAEKVKAKYEGTLERRLIVHGEALDACMYSLIKDT